MVKPSLEEANRNAQHFAEEEHRKTLESMTSKQMLVNKNLHEIRTVVNKRLRIEKQEKQESLTQSLTQLQNTQQKFINFWDRKPTKKVDSTLEIAEMSEELAGESTLPDVKVKKHSSFEEGDISGIQDKEKQKEEVDEEEAFEFIDVRPRMSIQNLAEAHAEHDGWEKIDDQVQHRDYKQEESTAQNQDDDLDRAFVTDESNVFMTADKNSGQERGLDSTIARKKLVNLSGIEFNTDEKEDSVRRVQDSDARILAEPVTPKADAAPAKNRGAVKERIQRKAEQEFEQLDK